MSPFLSCVDNVFGWELEELMAFFCRLSIRLTLEMDRQGVRLFRCTLSRLCKSGRIRARGGRSRDDRWTVVGNIFWQGDHEGGVQLGLTFECIETHCNVEH